MNSLPLWIILSPLSGAILLSLLAYTRVRPWIGRLSPLGVLPPLLLVGVLLPRVMQDGPVVYIPGGWSALKGISLVVDGVSAIMVGLGSGLGFLVLLYAMGERSHEPRYYVLLLLLITGMFSVVLSGDLFNIYVGMEILSITSYILIAVHRERQALLASLTYLLISSVGLGLFLIGTAMLYQMTGTLNLHLVAAHLSTHATPYPARMTLCAAFLLTYACIKSAIVPVHTWLADAHSEAPTPVSALLSGIVIKVGIYLIIRIAGLFNLPSMYILLLWTGALTALLGAILAVCQNDMKRILAHSSISQIGYIAVAFAAGTNLSAVVAVYHLINHAVFKSLLFLSVGAVAYQTGTREVTRLTGLGRPMPFIALTCTVGALSISGIPPFNGYISKTLIMHTLAHHPIPAFLLTLSGIGTIASFTKLIRIFYGPAPPLHSKPWSPWMKAPMLILMLCCVALGLIPNTWFFLLSRLIDTEPVTIIPFWSMTKGFKVLLSMALGFLLYYLVIHKVSHWAHTLRNIRLTVDLKLMVLIVYVIAIAILFRMSL